MLFTKKSLYYCDVKSGKRIFVCHFSRRPEGIMRAMEDAVQNLRNPRLYQLEATTTRHALGLTQCREIQKLIEERLSKKDSKTGRDLRMDNHKVKMIPVEFYRHVMMADDMIEGEVFEDD